MSRSTVTEKSSPDDLEIDRLGFVRCFLPGREPHPIYGA